MRGRNRQHLVRIVVAGAIAVSLSSIAMGAFEAGPKAAAGEGLIVWAENTRPVEPRRAEVREARNDLRPRPLGMVRESRAATSTNTATKASGASQTAASAMWDNPVVRTGGSLLLVLLLIVGLAGVAKRLVSKGGGLAGALGAGGRAPEGLLEVLGRYPLTRGQTLILLKVDSRVLLLSQTTPRIRGGVGTLMTLCEITQPEEVASILVKAGEHESGSASGKFTSLLRAFDRSHAATEADHVDIDLRRVSETASGDRAELWDETAVAPEIEEAPAVVHKFPAARPARSAFVERPAPAPQHFEPVAVNSGADSFGAIRQRLHALRGEAHR